MIRLSKLADYGIVIATHHRNHQPPHFHVIFGECHASVAIQTGIVTGWLPANVKRSVEKWRLHRLAELGYCWKLARDRLPLIQVPPLE